MENVYILKKDLNRWIAKYFDKDLISIDDMLAVIESLDEEKEHLEEQLEHKDKYYQDNWKPVDEMIMYGLNERNYH